ncbi:MAG: bifunctional folylpolyglutamate synthase/dihydrofolate synthase [Oscillospiraceae bacterium]|nr:bifunctional folylpolyglutamate synthase/dihydrofolate synthase [Oscillospiraceae bacterium]
MNYQESENYIHSFRRFTKEPGLKGIRMLLDLLGSPQKSLQFIHVAGTNGKGSTTAMCAAVLREAGYRTGMFVSPYVLNFRERIQIDGQMIPEEAMAALCEEIQTAVAHMEEQGVSPAEFEVVTALGMLWFARQQCDVVCLEVGLGGRLDATNAIDKSLVSVICAIGYDHTQILGDTLQKIAFEKCGILKPGGICVSYPRQDAEALAEIMEQCAEKNNRLIVPNAESVEIHTESIFGSQFRYRELDFDLPLAGRHQIYNFLTAFSAIEIVKSQGFAISDKNITNGIAKVAFPARMERISVEPLVVLDGAHNLQGCEALAKAMALTHKKKIVIMGMLRDKDWTHASAMIAKGASAFFAVTPDNPRALPAEELAQQITNVAGKAMAFSSVKKAVAAAKRLLDRDTALFCCGSLYLASQIRPILLEEFAEK